MTTSFETSLRMKELNFPQEGEYYWYNCVREVVCLHYRSFDAAALIASCRAFTLGELVRMLPYYTEVAKLDGGFIVKNGFDNATNTSPEEAAAELAIELVKSGVIKFEKEG